jgi:hypothetical protein
MMKVMKQAMLVFCVMLVPALRMLAAPCGSPEHAAFDFWVGDWDVTDASGKLAGTSHVERILDGCVVLENWTGAQGGYAGKSFNTLDPATGQWTQHYVDVGGLSAILTGSFQNGNLIYRRQFKRKDGTEMTTRMTFFNVEPGRVRQLVEQSKDGGKTWVVAIDLRYSRKAK